jgi:hypothetical protein
MRLVLLEREGGPPRTTDLAFEIAKQGLYRRRDGLPASASDIAARVSMYPGLFPREGYMVGLRIPRPRSMRRRPAPRILR